jgi:hypothetical protein
MLGMLKAFREELSHDKDTGPAMFACSVRCRRCAVEELIATVEGR